MQVKSKKPRWPWAVIPWRKRFYWRLQTRWLKRQRAHRASKHPRCLAQNGLSGDVPEEGFVLCAGAALVHLRLSVRFQLKGGWNCWRRPNKLSNLVSCILGHATCRNGSSAPLRTVRSTGRPVNSEQRAANNVTVSLGRSPRHVAPAVRNVVSAGHSGSLLVGFAFTGGAVIRWKSILRFFSYFFPVYGRRR